jgi:hypothetical protein
MKKMSLKIFLIYKFVENSFLEKIIENKFK